MREPDGRKQTLDPGPPLDQRLARVVVRPLARTAVTPNQLSFLCLAVGLVAAILLASASPVVAGIGAVCFMVAVFLDHTDGELARMTGQASTFGHRLDYFIGSAIYTVMYIGLGYGLYVRGEPFWYAVLGVAAGLINIPTVFLRIRMELDHGTESVEHPRVGPFELEDAIYLIGPFAVLGALDYFLVFYGFGALGYFAWTCFEALRYSRNRGQTT